MYRTKESQSQSQSNSLDELMNNVCKELHLNYISDIRFKHERKNVINYLKRHNVEGTQKENYLKLLNYIGLI